MSHTPWPEGLYEWVDQSARYVCLYNRKVENGRPFTILGVACLDTTKEHWSISKLWAPGHGKRFYELLVSLSGDHGLSPDPKGGHVVKAASKIWEKMYRSGNYTLKPINGPHLDEWLNTVYYTSALNPEIAAARERHRTWTRGWFAKIQKYFGHTLNLEGDIRSLAYRKFVVVADLFSAKHEEGYPGHFDLLSAEHKKEGYQAVVEYVARRLALQIRQMQTGTFILDAGTEFYGYPVHLDKNKKYYRALRNEAHQKQPLHEKPYYQLIKTPTALTFIEVPNVATLLSEKSDFVMAAKRIVEIYEQQDKFPANAFQFIANNWPVIANELQIEGCAGIASGQDIFICLENSKPN